MQSFTVRIIFGYVIRVKELCKCSITEEHSSTLKVEHATKTDRVPIKAFRNDVMNCLQFICDKEENGNLMPSPCEDITLSIRD